MVPQQDHADAAMIIFTLSFSVDVEPPPSNIASDGARSFATLVSCRCSRCASDAQASVALNERRARHPCVEDSRPLLSRVTSIASRFPALSSAKHGLEKESDLRRWLAASASDIGERSHRCRRSQVICLESDELLANSAEEHSKDLNNVMGALFRRSACNASPLNMNGRMSVTVRVVNFLRRSKRFDSCSSVSIRKRASEISHLDLTGLEAIVILRGETPSVRRLNVSDLFQPAWVPRFESVNCHEAGHGCD